MTLTLQKTDMFLFSKSQAKSLLKSLNIDVKRSGKDMKVMISDKQQAHCKACGSPITYNNLGHVVKGSKILYCDRPSCFTYYVVNNKIR